jgi:ligand-binding SRPBCC domain-containing protein
VARDGLFESVQFVPRPPAEVFSFFSDLANLERITAPWTRFRNVPPVPRELRAGIVIRHRLRVAGLPFRWDSRIDAWEPPRRFVDVQTRGPFARLRHEHTFVPAPGGTIIWDRIEYAAPFGPLGTLVRALHVDRNLRRAFDYRRNAIAAILGAGGTGTPAR